MRTESREIIEIARSATDVAAAELDHEAWLSARPIRIERYWSGEEAPPGRRLEARLLWSRDALHVRFVCAQAEPLVVSREPQTRRKTIGLWERDVCEIFVAPSASAPDRYFEFEAAPTGEWLDLAIRKIGDGRETDWEFHSGMTTAARASEDQITIAMRIPFEALGGAPAAGTRWGANLTRCVGPEGSRRGYLAWQPTYTERPDFHVPSAFGEVRFK